MACGLVLPLLFLAVCISGTASTPCRTTSTAKGWIGLQTDCRGRLLTAIPGDLPDDITFLNLRDNYLVKVTLDDLPYLRLRHLDLAFNNLTSIKPGTFSKLSLLETLDLRFNRISHEAHALPPGSFYGLHRLIDLRLAQCSYEDYNKKNRIGQSKKWVRNAFVPNPYHVSVFQDVPMLKKLNLGCFGGQLAPIPKEIANLAKPADSFIWSNNKRVYRGRYLSQHG